MSLDIIRERLKGYESKTVLEEAMALKEISQEIILMGLSRRGFFSEAEFHGGTALRIFYGLQRFSEDLDFALLVPNKFFALTPYLKGLEEELHAFGYDFEIQDRSDANKIVKKAFLKDNSIGKLLFLNKPDLSKKIMIKLEIDSNPPLGAQVDIKYLSFPSPFGVKVKDLSSSFAGKVHALLCRNYVKGRDWYDFIWYVSRKVDINFALLKNALQQHGPWHNQNIKMSVDWVVEMLNKKIKTIDWQQASQDVSPFIKAQEQASLQIWGEPFFLDLVLQMSTYL